jgi:hypothetical protein
MSEDWSTAASLATALGTLVLALATFVAERAANRAARVAEYSMQIGIRPLLMPSRLEDTVQKIMWSDEHWTRLSGARRGRRDRRRQPHLAMSVRNAGSGVAVIHGWHLVLQDLLQDHPHAEPDELRRQLRDLYVPGDDVGFWRSAIATMLSTLTCSSVVRHLGSSRSSSCAATARVAIARSGDSLLPR